MRIDAHQHFWQIGRGDYGWLTEALGAIYRDFQPIDLAPEVESAGIEGTILVQAAPTLAETEYLLDIAAQTDFVKGVVGWVDFEEADAADKITKKSKNPLLVGLRPMVQDIPDTEWMLRSDIAPTIEAMIRCDLTFDALVLPHHLPTLGQFIERYPRLRIVIDHGAKPRIADGEINSWATEMANIARTDGVYCKLSGLVTEAGPDWDAQSLKPYVDVLLSAFGSQRLIWGSDWPVATLATSYKRWHDTAHDLLSELDSKQHEAIFGDNAARAYLLRNSL